MSPLFNKRSCLCSIQPLIPNSEKSARVQELDQIEKDSHAGGIHKGRERRERRKGERREEKERGEREEMRRWLNEA